MLVGRQVEGARLEGLLRAARDGTSGALAITGDPGVGKTALLDFAAERADGFTVIRVVGVETEAELAYAALHQLVWPLFDRLGELPEPQAAALRTVLGVASDGAVDRLLLGASVLTLLSAASDDGPVLCLLDDAHWFDRASTEVIGFAARRIRAESVVLLFAAREDEEHALEIPGITELRLAPLEESESHDLLASAFGARITAETRRAVVGSAGGNPLALLEFAGRAAADGARPDMRAQWGTSIERAYAERIGSLPGESQALIVLAAAESSPDLTALGRAGGVLGLDLDALEPAELDGLIWVADGRLVFRHPLVRSAAYRAATFSQRQSAHAAWAEILTAARDADRRAWHRAAAAVGPDEAVAAELEATAARAQVRSGHAAAATALQRAAELSEDAEARARRLVGAAGAAWSAGQLGPARLLVDEAEPLLGEPGLRAELLFARGSIELTAGSPAAAMHLLEDAAGEAVTAGSPGRAVELLALATHAAGIGGHMASIAEIAGRLEALEGASPTPARWALTGMSAFVAGDLESAVPALRQTLARAGEVDDPRALATWGAASAVFLGDDDHAIALLSGAIDLARARGALAPLSFAIERRGYLLAWQGRTAEAHIDAEEGLALALEAGLENSSAQHRAVLAFVAALRGDATTSRDEATQAQVLAEARGLAHVWGTATWALAVADVGAGLLDAATDRLLSLSDPRPAQVHPWIALRTTPDLVEAACRCGRTAEAAEPLERFDAWASRSGSEWAQALALRCRGLLAGGLEAESLLLEALQRHGASASPFQRARTQLCLGEAMRRGRKRVESREHLRAAEEVFEKLGARPWADRARAELRATGETVRRRDPSAVAELTPQELQIARLVGGGAINRDIAAQLFLSPKTVEYHLHKIFQKLGIKSRAELSGLTTGVESPLAARSALTA